MRRLFDRALVIQAVLAVILAVGACKKSKEDTSSTNAGPPGGGRMVGPNREGGPGASTPIREIMVKLTKGPQSLTSLIGDELKAEPPPWDTIQAQTKEYVQLAGSMAKHDPPKGSKESWAKQTSLYTESATALEKAAQSKNKEKALEVHQTITDSCMACHREHRGGPGGPGGGRPGGFGPPGGGRPGGGPPG